MPEQKKPSGSRRITLVLLLLLLIISAIVIFRALQPQSRIPEKAVLMLEVRGPLPERIFIDAPPFDAPFGSSQPLPTFQSILRALHRAKSDARIRLVVLNISNLSASFSKIAELREAVEAARQSGKEVWAYLRGGSDKEYYLATACNKIYVEPYSVLIIDGLSFESLYFKTALEKVGIEVEAIRRGKYKSAVEQFTRDSQSDADREQDEAILDAFDKAYVQAIAKGRNLSESEVRQLINDVAYFSENAFVSAKLADSVTYMNDLKERLKSQLGISDDDEEIFIDLSDYAQETREKTGEKIAVVYVQGGIVNGKGAPQPDGNDNTGDSPITKALEDAREDESIKAIILRVDSPGGSVTASEKMAQAILKAKAKKPVVVSMSGVAASGGYWISADGNKILAHPLTITGSIGIFALKPNLKKLQDEIGLKRQVLLRGKYADAYNLFEKLSPEAYQKVNALINEGYQRFLSRVANGRNMTTAAVDSIAQGRVWIGETAKNLGLVDELGGFYRAVDIAKELAGIQPETSVQFVEYPKRKSFFDLLFGEDDDSDAQAQLYEWLKAAFRREMYLELFLSPVAAEEAQRWRNALTEMLRSPLTLMARLPREIIVK
ncbi:MAG: signal peptide peptidase SppA [Chloroherpetonaceae bacterium]|nr:signal peptide peptidase SppA [Chloroherpetonaceae bacterium]